MLYVKILYSMHISASIVIVLIFSCHVCPLSIRLCSPLPRKRCLTILYVTFSYCLPVDLRLVGQLLHYGYISSYLYQSLYISCFHFIFPMFSLFLFLYFPCRHCSVCIHCAIRLYCNLSIYKVESICASISLTTLLFR